MGVTHGVNMGLARLTQPAQVVPTIPAPPTVPAMPVRRWLDFAGYLARKHSISGDLLSQSSPPDKFAGGKKLRDLWQLTNLSANDFADEVACFYNLPRVKLPQLLDR